MGSRKTKVCLKDFPKYLETHLGSWDKDAEEDKRGEAPHMVLLRSLLTIFYDCLPNVPLHCAP